MFTYNVWKSPLQIIVTRYLLTSLNSIVFLFLEETSTWWRKWAGIT